MNLKKTIFAAALLIALFPAGQAWGRVASVQDSLPRQLDSTTLSAIHAKVTEYLSAIETEPVELQKQETDFLIGTCSDSLVKQAVALMIYDYYLQSKIMGTEAVAVYVCDKWFIPGKIKMHSDLDLMNARIYAEFNRSSLIGMPAPEMTLLDTSGVKRSLFPSGKATEGGRTLTDSSPEAGAAPAGTGPALTANGKYSVLYFYSTDCPRCRVETVLLKEIIENDGFPINFFAIYTGRNRQEWTEYIGSRLRMEAPSTEIYHLWDPQMESDFQIKYGIMQTPGLFLVSPDGTILGRRLDAISLEKLLKTALTPVEMEYGSEESSKFYDKVFAPYGDSISCQNINATARHIAQETLGQGDTLLFKQMTGDLMYYMTNKRGQAWKCALGELLKTGILDHPAWRTPDDSLKVLSFAEILDDLLSRSPEGSRIADIKVDAVLKKSSAGGDIKTEEGRFSLAVLGRKQNYIIFFTEGCPVCKAEIQAADSLLTKRGKGTGVLLVDMDMLFSSYPDQTQALLEAFDLTALPLIISTDRKGIVTGKYLTLTK